MRWEKTFERIGDKSDCVKYQGWMDFPTTRWNKKTSRLIVEFEYYDSKDPKGWWLDQVRYYQPKPRKQCKMKFHVFQNLPDHMTHSEEKSSSREDKGVPYEDFTIKYCLEITKLRLETFLKHITDQL